MGWLCWRCSCWGHLASLRVRYTRQGKDKVEACEPRKLTHPLPHTITPHLGSWSPAGDCFTGAFAVAMLEGKEQEERLEFAAAAAALCIQRAGAMPSMPTRQELERGQLAGGGSGGEGAATNTCLGDGGSSGGEEPHAGQQLGGGHGSSHARTTSFW